MDGGWSVVSDRCGVRVSRSTSVSGARAEAGATAPREGASALVAFSLRSWTGPAADDDVAAAARRAAFDGPRSRRVGEFDDFFDADVDRCVRLMRVGERAEFVVEYRDAADAPALRVEFALELLEVDASSPFELLDVAEKLAIAERRKQNGVRLAKLGRNSDAFRAFGGALKAALTVSPHELDDEATHERRRELIAKLYNNLAHCQLAFERHSEAASLCTRTLDIDPHNVKALYRRASALMGSREWEAAHSDMSRVLELDRSLPEATRKMAVLREKLRDVDEAYKRTIKNMFT